MRVVTHITVQLERENEIMLVKCLAGFLEHQNHLISCVILNLWPEKLRL